MNTAITETTYPKSEPIKSKFEGCPDGEGPYKAKRMTKNDESCAYFADFISAARWVAGGAAYHSDSNMMGGESMVSRYGEGGVFGYVYRSES
jgi:hypothetical protein